MQRRPYVPDQSQRDFITDFFLPADHDRDRAERQRNSAHVIIDQSPADPRVKALLHALADFPKPTKDERGNWIIKVGVSTLEARLARSRNTVRTWLRMACHTPYLLLLDDSKSDEKTYVVQWRKILDRELTNPNETNKRSAVTTTEDAESANKRIGTSATEDVSERSIHSIEGGQFPSGGGSIHEPRGVNFTPQGGQLTGVKSPHTPLLKTPENVFDRDINKKRFQESLSKGGQNRPAGFWSRWIAAVATRDLTNPQHVHELHFVAIQLEIVDEKDDLARGRIFAQAALNERLWRNGKTRGERNSLFTSNVAARRWWCSCADDDVGRELMKRAEVYHRTNDAHSEMERLKKWAAEREAAQLTVNSPGG